MHISSTDVPIKSPPSVKYPPSHHRQSNGTKRSPYSDLARAIGEERKQQEQRQQQSTLVCMGTTKPSNNKYISALHFKFTGGAQTPARVTTNRNPYIEGLHSKLKKEDSTKSSIPMDTAPTTLARSPVIPKSEGGGLIRGNVRAPPLSAVTMPPTKNKYIEELHSTLQKSGCSDGSSSAGSPTCKKEWLNTALEQVCLYSTHTHICTGHTHTFTYMYMHIYVDLYTLTHSHSHTLTHTALKRDCPRGP